MSVGCHVTDHFDLTFNTTREDWIAVNEALMRISPQWAAAAKSHRRKALRDALWSSPLIITFASISIGSRSSTRGMYVEGALVGVLFSFLIAFGLSRIDRTTQTKQKYMAQIKRMDLSSHVGPVRVTADEQGVFIKTPVRELKLSWAAVVVHDVGDYFLLSHGGSDGSVVPKHAFGSPTEAAAFGKQTLAWWQAAQLPPAERVARYLEGRDVACPGCAYNLRGVRQDRCPECGRALTLEELLTAKQ
jgi:hypothetical protein